MPVGVRFGDHFIADDVQHRAACEGQRKGQDRRRDGDGKIADQRADHLDQSRGQGQQKGSPRLDTGRQHRADDDHTLGNVLKRDTARDHQGLRGIPRAKADARRDSLGQIVNGDGHHEQKHAAQFCVVMRLALHAYHLMQMRDELVDEIEALGYHEIDLNMGCPFPLQAKHGRGSGILAHPDIVEEIAHTIKEHTQLTFSVKMRLGWDNAEEWEPVLNILNDTSLTHITLHPRTGVQQYKGDIDYDAFAQFYEGCHHPIIYNGELTTPTQLRDREERYPRLAGLMVGRGLLARPSLAKEYLEGREWSHEEHIRSLQTLHEKLMEQYAKIVKGDAQLHSKLRNFWEYTEPLIGHKPYKKIMKSGNLRNYMSAIDELR